jgi:transcriptional regulator with XRE-family HTH domain
MNREEERQRIGQRIADLRKQKGMTQQDLADITGNQRNHISRIESGKYSVGFDTLQAIAEAIGGTIDIVVSLAFMLLLVSCGQSGFGKGGSNAEQFVRENAPEDSGTRCLVDCPRVDECLYSAKRIYIDHPDRWSFYVWDALENIENPTIEDKIELLKTSPYGVCAFKSDNNVVDHQSVNVLFESGATGIHNMVGGTSYGTRTIFISGTKGVITGDFEKGEFTVSLIDPSPDCEHKDTTYDLKVGNDTHGGGDLDLVRDFVAYCRNETHSVSCTDIHDSLSGHLAVFLADRSRENNGMPEKVIL